MGKCIGLVITDEIPRNYKDLSYLNKYRREGYDSELS